jgi:hypothetical protein
MPVRRHLEHRSQHGVIDQDRRTVPLLFQQTVGNGGASGEVNQVSGWIGRAFQAN